MFDKKLHDMTRHELEQVIAHCREKMRKAEMNGIFNEYDVYQSKMLIAESFLINPDDIKIGHIYPLKSDATTYFKVERLKGVFAWGYTINGNQPEEGIPIALLKL